jgi:prepilin-type N-terminal cleavage/methylation domain-containing protein
MRVTGLLIGRVGACNVKRGNAFSAGTQIARAAASGQGQQAEGRSMWCEDASLVLSGRARRGGYTLLELVIVMVILSIVAGIAVPAMQSAAQSSRLETGRQTFIGDLRLARTEAIRRNRSVYVAMTSPSTYTIEYIGGRTLKEGVTFESAPDTVRFAAFGPLQTGMATYVLDLDGTNTTVRLSAAGNASTE